jgi:hypothetical protein
VHARGLAHAYGGADHPANPLGLGTQTRRVNGVDAAPQDQWWNGRTEVPVGAEHEIWNMHPDRAVQRGHLPDWRVRCFADRHGSAGELREIAMRLTTAWFFPHHDRVLLI